MNGRTQWIDWAKTIGIWLVVFGHIPGIHLVVQEFIYVFHMPLFFFMSGYLVKSKSVVEAVKSGVVRLLIPYVLFYVLTWLWWFVFGYLRHLEWFSHLSAFQAALVQPLFGLLFGVGHGSRISNMINVPLWFLVGLFQVSVVFALVDSLKSRRMKSTVLLLMSGIPYVLTRHEIDLLFSLDSALMALPFYAAGKYAADAGLASRLSRSWVMRGGYCSAVVVVLLLVLLGFLTATNGRVDINDVNYGRYPPLFYLGGLAGIFLVWVISVWCARWIYGPTICTISRGAIVILALHGILTGCCIALLRALHVEHGLLLSATISTVVVVLCVPIIETIESAAPMLVGKRKASSGVPLNTVVDLR